MTDSADGRGTDGGRMNAIRVHEYGDAGVLSYETLPRPTPASGELLVRVHAAGVNPIDWMVREGYVDEALAPSLPYVPGWDLSGTVESVGPGVEVFEPGASVFGLVGMPAAGSTYAEYAAVSAADVVEKPATLGHTEAAGLPMVALTARRALFEAGGLRAGQRVLVHAAAGGVGHVAVQLADHAGAHVVGTASERNESYLRDLGVDEFVDYRSQRFEEVLEEVDLVVDGVGGETLERSIEVLKEGGRLVTLPEPPDERIVERATRRGVSVDWFSVEPDPAALASMRELVDAGHVTPTISDTWPLREAAAAHEVSQEGHVRGKLVLEVAPGADRS